MHFDYLQSFVRIFFVYRILQFVNDSLACWEHILNIKFNNKYIVATSTVSSVISGLLPFSFDTTQEQKSSPKYSNEENTHPINYQKTQQ